MSPRPRGGFSVLRAFLVLLVLGGVVALTPSVRAAWTTPPPSTAVTGATISVAFQYSPSSWTSATVWVQRPGTSTWELCGGGGGVLGGNISGSGGFNCTTAGTYVVKAVGGSVATGTAIAGPSNISVSSPAPVISSSGTASGVVGTAFSYQITASNSPTSFGATNLPGGLSVNTSTGVISGTPTAVGTSNVTLSATNGGGTGTKTLTITITAAPVITSSGTASGAVGTAFSYQITASNSPTSFGATSLPSGLSVNTSTGVISGTPTAGGTSNVTLSATNATGTGTKTLTITILAAPVITSSGSASGAVGAGFSYQITASNSPTSFGASNLPSGLSVNSSNGVISGTPTSTGTTNVTMSATNAAGTGTKALTITISAAPGITSSGSASGFVGVAFSYQITANNSPTSFGASNLPAGLSVNTGNGVISGTPTSGGTTNVTLSANNAIGTGTKTLTITILPAPVITSSGSASGTVGTAFSYQITASNSPTSFGASNLPAGLSVNSSNGVISGTPTSGGTTSVTLSATNGAGTGTATLTLSILAAPVVTSAGSASGNAGTAFSYQITASNSPTSFGASNLPAGLSVNTSTGAISGTPTSAGTTSVTLSATNAAGTGTKTLTLTVTSVPVITSSGYAGGTVGTAFSYQITASNSPTSFGASNLPEGLSVNTSTGVISGIPRSAAVSNVTLSATSGGGTGTATLTLTIIAAPLAQSGWTTPPPSSAVTGATISVTFQYSPSSWTGATVWVLRPGSSTWEQCGGGGGTIGGTISGSGGFGCLDTGTHLVKAVGGSAASGTPIAGPTSISVSMGNDPPSCSLTYPSTLTTNQSFTISMSGFDQNGDLNSMAVRWQGVGLVGGPWSVSGRNASQVTPTLTAPATPGSFTVRGEISDNAGHSTNGDWQTIVVNPPPPVITSSASTGGGVGTWFSYQITASNSPTSFGATNLPAGLSVNTSTGVISGTPTSIGTSNVTMSATNAGGTGTAALTITISAAPVITSSGSASGIVGTAFNYQITAANSPTSFGATNLPAGLSVNTSTGAISGTPTSGGTTSVTLSATNGIGTGTATLTISILAAPVITSSGSASGTAGTAFNSYQITASNSPTSFGATGLPAGLSVNTGSGLISGTPTAVGTTSVTISATNAAGTGAKTLTITISAPPAPVITSSGSASGFVGTTFSYQITASNSPTSFGATNLPAGLSVNTGTGVISGAPTSGGTTSVTMSATNAGGTGTATLTITILPAPVITSSGSASGNVGTAFNYQITASNSPASYGATNLPAGLSVNTSTGAISGTPTSAGTTGVTISATNPAGTGSATLTIAVTSVPVITSSGNAGGTVGTAFTYQITASNSPTSFGASNLPEGLSINTSTGLISGIPRSAAVSSVTLSATSGGGTGTATLTLTIIAAPLAQSGWTTPPPSSAVTGATVSVTFQYSPSSWTGATVWVLRPGSSTWEQCGGGGGTIGGTISGSGGFGCLDTGTHLVKAVGGSAASGTPIAGPTSISVSMGNDPPSCTLDCPSTLTTSQSFTITINGSDQNGDLNSMAVRWQGVGLVGGPWSISGHNASQATPTLTAPATPGSFTVRGEVSDNAGHSYTGNWQTIVVNPSAPVITSSGSTTGTVGTVFSYHITASNSPTSYNATNLPVGLTVNTSTGEITGTPTSIGTSNVTVSATNVTGTGTAPLTITISAGPPVITSPSSASGTVGVPFSYNITATNSPTSYGATNLPAGLSVAASTGVISGTPTSGGTTNVTLSATNATGTGTAPLTITVGVGVQDDSTNQNQLNIHIPLQ